MGRSVIFVHRSIKGKSMLAHPWIPYVSVSIWLFINLEPSVIFRHQPIEGKPTSDHRKTLVCIWQYPTVYRSGTIGQFQNLLCWRKANVSPPTILVHRHWCPAVYWRRTISHFQAKNFQAFSDDDSSKETNVSSLTILVHQCHYQTVYRSGAIGHFQVSICQRKTNVGSPRNLVSQSRYPTVY